MFCHFCVSSIITARFVDKFLWQEKIYIGFVGDLDPILGLDIGICSIGMRSNMSRGECT